MKEMERMDASKIEIYTDIGGRVYVNPEGKGFPWLIVEEGDEPGSIQLSSRAVDSETKGTLTKWEAVGKYDPLLPTQKSLMRFRDQVAEALGYDVEEGRYSLRTLLDRIRFLHDTSLKTTIDNPPTKSLGKTQEPSAIDLLKHIVATQAQIIADLTERISK
ncbi:hypothetical protein SEA_FULCRUM_93 [Gordonia phage Fulcrum]|uniref:Uncharacterized protein n=1 Tax=Gordonia phage Fulcrum TaxID=3077818 RepID=A0AA96QUZ8_9CAUD|nr:hypothetical protein SEA_GOATIFICATION_93 [Gordonia phage GOATification]WNO27204.1 hypothetical protein SEA_FULCRUM_93 [Gordonia phage Fulcrum]